MFPKYVVASVFAITSVVLVPGLSAQDNPAPAPAPAAAPVTPPDAKSALAALEKAMGVGSVKTISYSGAGSNAGIGQNQNPGAGWPLVRVKSYTREIDFGAPASRVQMVRVQNGADQKQDQTVQANAPWGQQYDVWVTPVAFVKGAIANNATVEAKTLLGIPYTAVSFMVQNKYKVVGYIDAQNMLHKVETWIENQVFGDLSVETYYTDYKDFGGVKYPTMIIQKQDGRNTLLLIVSDVKPNAAVTIPAPQPRPPHTRRGVERPPGHQTIGRRHAQRRPSDRSLEWRRFGGGPCRERCNCGNADRAGAKREPSRCAHAG